MLRYTLYNFFVIICEMFLHQLINFFIFSVYHYLLETNLLLEELHCNWDNNNWAIVMLHTS